MVKKKELAVKPAEEEVAKGVGSVIELAHQIWLAGVGAFAKAEAEGGQFFESLVKEGEAVEERTKKVAEEKIEAIKTKASESWEKVEEMFQERVARVLKRLGVPTHEDLSKLSKQVEALDKSIKELTKTRGRSRRAGKGG